MTIRHRFKTHILAPVALGMAGVSFVGLGMAGIGLSIAPHALAQSSSEQAELQRVERHLRGIRTLTANFTQTDRSNQQLSGTLTLKQPGKIRFEYQKDAELLIVSDGRALTLVDYQVGQVERWPISDSPLGALLDPKRDVTRYGRVVDRAGRDIISVEVKDDDHPEYGTITMIFRPDSQAPEGIEMAGWVALDSQNKRTTISLSGHRYNQSVADSAFEWVDPRIKAMRRR